MKVLIAVLLAAVLFLGCDDPPKVVGTVRISVTNQLGNSVIEEAAWNAGLAWINQQLENEGIHVMFVPSGQGRGEITQVVVTDKPSMSSDELVIVVTDKHRWREQALEQALEVFGK